MSGARSGPPRPAYLVQGSDAGLVSQALSALLGELAGSEGAGAIPIEEYGEPGRDEQLMLGPVLDACRTPPFLADRRVVVARSATGIDAAQANAVTAYLADPLDTTVLVLALSGKAAPAAVAKAVREVGAVIDTEPAGGGRARTAWFSEHVRASGVHLDASATGRLEEHLGEDLARLSGILSTLESAFGPGARLSREDLEPFLGHAGGVAPWDLTDALDKGDGPGALAALGRLLGGGERHPLQVIATLQRHYGAMLRLDGADVTDEQGAALLTGLRPFPAKKALVQSRRLGHRGITRSIALLAGADLDLRGRTGWPPELVMEVLIARLAQLARLAGASGAGRRAAAR
ncbi:MAG: holA [Acidimicrobiaceae bacterium]|nr:holA [Acidimicrobiaceae bacterium]